MIERHFNVPFVAALALREKQIQQNYRPVIAVHKSLAEDAAGVAEIVRRDIESLAEAGLTATQGDIRCICFGQLTRLAIWNLRGTWNSKRPVTERMNLINEWFTKFGGVSAVLTSLKGVFSKANRKLVDCTELRNFKTK